MAPLTITARSTQATKLNNTGIGNDKYLGSRTSGRYIKAYPFYYKNETGGTIAADSIIELTRIGPGRVLGTSTVEFSAMGASRTLDVGLQEYEARDGSTTASDIDAFLDGTDVSSAGTTTFEADTASTARGQGVEVDGEAMVLAKIIGGTLPNNGVIQGVLHVLSN